MPTDTLIRDYPTVRQNHDLLGNTFQDQKSQALVEMLRQASLNELHIKDEGASSRIHGALEQGTISVLEGFVLSELCLRNQSWEDATLVVNHLRIARLQNVGTTVSDQEPLYYDDDHIVQQLQSAVEIVPDPNVLGKAGKTLTPALETETAMEVWERRIRDPGSSRQPKKVEKYRITRYKTNYLTTELIIDGYTGDIMLDTGDTLIRAADIAKIFTNLSARDPVRDSLTSIRQSSEWLTSINAAKKNQPRTPPLPIYETISLAREALGLNKDFWKSFG